jgi:hypothetical protein
MRASAFLFALTLCLAAPIWAFAQTPAEKARAEQQFRQARKSMEARDFQKALELLRESQSIEKRPSTLLNIAVCEEELGQLATALLHFREVGPQLPPRDARLAIIKEHVDKLEPRVPRLDISVPAGAPTGTTVTLDGSPVEPAAWGAPIAVDPGPHVVVVTAPGAPPQRREVLAVEARSLVVSFAPWSSAPRPPDRRAPSPSDGRRDAGFVVGGVGLAGLGVFAVTGFLAIAQHDALEKECPSHVGCSRSVVDGAESGKALTVASTVGLAIGVAGLAAGTFLVVTSAPGKKPPTTATFGFAPLAGGAALSASGSF